MVNTKIQIIEYLDAMDEYQLRLVLSFLKELLD